MPRKVDLEAKLLADKDRLRAEQARRQAALGQLDRQIAQERYRKQRAWEAKVGRIAWEKGLHTVFEDDLSGIEKLFDRLTPNDLFGEHSAETLQREQALVPGNL